MPPAIRSSTARGTSSAARRSTFRCRTTLRHGESGIAARPAGGGAPGLTMRARWPRRAGSRRSSAAYSATAHGASFATSRFPSSRLRCRWLSSVLARPAHWPHWRRAMPAPRCCVLDRDASPTGATGLLVRDDPGGRSPAQKARGGRRYARAVRRRHPGEVQSRSFGSSPGRGLHAHGSEALELARDGLRASVSNWSTVVRPGHSAPRMHALASVAARLAVGPVSRACGRGRAHAVGARVTDLYVDANSACVACAISAASASVGRRRLLGAGPRHQWLRRQMPTWWHGICRTCGRCRSPVTTAARATRSAGAVELGCRDETSTASVAHSSVVMPQRLQTAVGADDRGRDPGQSCRANASATNTRAIRKARCSYWRSPRASPSTSTTSASTRSAWRCRTTRRRSPRG